MKAKYDRNRATKYTTSHRKEGKCHFEEYSIVTMKAGEPNPRYRVSKPVELRLYGTGNVNFACLWIRVPSKAANECPKCGESMPNTTCPKCVVRTMEGKAMPEIYTQGSGRAGGYGYHRPSAAAGEAIRNAGFELLTDEGKPCDIGGVGESAIEEALCAIADAIGLKDYALVRSHP
jgi:ribosomal protein L32